MAFCGASDSTRNSKNSPSLYTYLSPLSESVLRPKSDSKTAWSKGNERSTPREWNGPLESSLLLSSTLGLVSFVESGEQIYGEVAQPKSPHERQGLRMSSSVHNATSRLYHLLCSHVTGLWLCSHWYIPTRISLCAGTRHPVCSLKFSISHKCLDPPPPPLPMRCSYSTSYFLVLHQVLAQKFCSCTLYPSSRCHPPPNSQQGSGPIPAAFMTRQSGLTSFARTIPP